MDKKECVFCKIVRKEVPSKIVFEDADILAFEDLRPQAPIHMMVIPKSHIEKVSDIKEENLRLIGSLVLAAGNIARQNGIEESGYRIVINCNRDAGQEVFHLHLHLLGGREFSWPPG